MNKNRPLLTPLELIRFKKQYDFIRIHFLD